MFLFVLEAQLLRENQRAARHQRLANPVQQRRPLFARDELQSEIHRHQRARLKLKGEHVRLDHIDR